MQEVDNALNQARRELQTRYDLKNSRSEILFEKDTFTLIADDNMKLKAVTEVLHQKLAKRGVSLRSLDPQPQEEAGGGLLKQRITVKQGISTDEGREIVKIIKERNLKKVQASIQGDQVRVTGPKRDDLQAAIQTLREKVTKLELQFVNFRD